HRNVGHARSAEEAPVALDFRGWAKRFRVVVGELYRRAAFDTGYFADQADGIKAAIAAGIAAAEIIGQQRAPAGAKRMRRRGVHLRGSWKSSALAKSLAVVPFASV